MTVKLPCSVVRDLLPLYAEKMIETETQELVDEHLADCPECRAKLSGIETGTGTETPVDTVKPLAALKKQIRRRRWFAVLIAGLLVFICVFTYFYHADDFVLVPWAEGLINVKGVEARAYEDLYEGQGQSGQHEPMVDALILEIDSRINGYEESAFVDDDGTRTVLLSCWSTKSDFPVPGKKRDYTEQAYCPVPDRLIYTCEGTSHLLYGKPMNGGVVTLPRLALAAYLLAALGLAAILGLLWFLFRRKERSWIPRQLFFAPASYAAAHFLILGFRTRTFFLERDLFSILLLTACIYALLTLAWQVWLHRKATV